MRALFIGLGLIGSAIAGDAQFQAHTPPESSLRAIGPETPEWPTRLSIEYAGRATIRAKYRFVYDAENGYSQNPYLFLLPDRESQSRLPYLTRGLQTDKAEAIWVTNVADAAGALLGKPMAEEMLAGKHAKIVGEAVVVIEGFSAGYECDVPAFGARFVEVKSEVSAPAAAAPRAEGC